MSQYQKPAELYDGLRLHQNENTGGCSPRVIEALAKLRPDQICFYPPYAAVTEACARHFDVPPPFITLTNGLDEGIMAVSVAYLRPRCPSSVPADRAHDRPDTTAADATIPEAIVPEPAFEIFRCDTAVAGGRLVQIMPAPDFRFALDQVLAAITPATRVVFITNPNNPTGVSMPLDAIGTIARRVPPGAVVFVDEAYADFAGRTFIPQLPAFPNVIVGRTFSKAYGLAGLRIGCLIGADDVMEPIREAVPVYSVNVAAVAALQAALQDRAHVDDYLHQVAESKTLLYAACQRLGLTYWPSDANFVLVRTGGRTDPLVRGAADRGVYLRDRSTEPGCEGCIRIAAGIVEHTRRAIAVMEEVLCAAP